MRIPTLSLVVLVCLILAAPSSGAAPLAEARRAADAALARPELAAYRGWIKYLLFEAETAEARTGAASAAAQEKRARLDDWLQRITADPALLGRLRGVQEWAYESPADDSGQPFKLMIPTDYDPAHPPGVSVYMHGYSGNHLEHATGMAAHPGDFDVSILGRARGGWYVGLSQADVLHVLDYIAAHWRIDPARVHLSGGSMGGGATFKFGARFPGRFASGQITCGYVQQEPLANLLTFPIYATHSDDDPVVPILLSRGPLRELRRLGAENIFDEATGYGHAVWNYAAGNQRSAAWAAHQVRPDLATIRHIDFTAVDGAAVRAWWAEVAEWGLQARPARFILTAATDNTFQLDLTNISRLRLHLDSAPFDRSRPLQVVAQGAVPRIIPAPLPAELDLDPSGAVAAPEAVPFRLHTPGGPLQLYNGEPLLIVYGTGGTPAARAAMQAAAEAASKSPNPSWARDGGEADPNDHVPHHQNLYGRLRTKADTDVTAEELARCHLVIIGSPEENAVAAKLAGRLPLRLADGRLACDDGFSLPFAGRAFGLVHFNPLAPTRLVFWVVSSDPAGYAAGATLPELTTPYFIGADLLVTSATGGTLVATRSFDSRWHWVPGRETTAVLPESLASHRALSLGVAAAVRRATGADFAVAGAVLQLGATAATAGTTRATDVASLYFAHTVDILDVSGDELVAIAAKLTASPGNDGAPLALEPAVDAAKLDRTRRYRVALPMELIFPFGRVTLPAPRGQTRSPIMVDDAIESYLGRP